MIVSVPRPEPPNTMRVNSSIVVSTTEPITGPNSVPTPPRMDTSAILIESGVDSTEFGSMYNSFCA